MPQFIKESDLFDKFEGSNKSIIENNKAILGIYKFTNIGIYF